MIKILTGKNLNVPKFFRFRNSEPRDRQPSFKFIPKLLPYSLNNPLKETICEILYDPPCKDGNARYTTVPLKALYELDINVFLSLNCIFSFAVSLQVTKVFLVYEKQRKIFTLRNSLRVRNTALFSTFLSDEGFKWYRVRYKSDKAIFAWRVTYKAQRPFIVKTNLYS